MHFQSPVRMTRTPILLSLCVMLLALLLSGCVVPAVEVTPPTPDPDQPVSSEDPTPATRGEEPATGEVVPVYIDDVSVQILESFPVQVSVTVEGNLPDPCTKITETEAVREDDTFQVTLTARRTTEEVCIQQLEPFSVTVPLEVEGLPAGEYAVVVNDEATASFTLDVDNVLVEEPPLPTADELSDEVSFEGISFTLPASVAMGVTYERIEAQEPSADAPPWVTAPEYVQFTLQDYVLSDTFPQPRILVYPVADYEEMSELAAEQIEALRTLLAEEPGDPEAPLPFLPIFNAAQMTHAQVGYVPFQNGMGVRYLTQYGQAANVINNQELFYTYQGLTDDGAYYVAAILPVSHPELPASSADETLPTDADAFDNYLAEVTAQLDNTALEVFTPGLMTLDQMMMSLSVQVESAQ